MRRVLPPDDLSFAVLASQRAELAEAARDAAGAAVAKLEPTLGPEHPDTRGAARLLATFTPRPGG